MSGRRDRDAVEADGTRRRAAVKVTVPIPRALFPVVERDATARGVSVGQWIGEVVEVRAAELAREAADRSGIEAD